MRRWTALVLLISVACGGGSAGSVVVGDGSPDSTLATSRSVTRQGDDFFVPDFTFTLSDGAVFDTAALETPVYIMFWAEW